MKSETMQMVSALIGAAVKDSAEREEVLAKLRSKTQAPDKLLKTREAAELAGCTRHTLRAWEKKGFLHPRRITKARVRWSRNELQDFLCGLAEG